MKITQKVEILELRIVMTETLTHVLNSRLGKAEESIMNLETGVFIILNTTQQQKLTNFLSASIGTFPNIILKERS